MHIWTLFKKFAKNLYAMLYVIEMSHYIIHAPKTSSLQ
jgi:hypothetical protein